MADFHASGLDDLMLSLQEIAEIPEDVQDEILNAQADVVLKAQRSSVEAHDIRDTGKTLASIKKGKVKTRKDGTRAIYITPAGSRKRGGKRRWSKVTTTRNAEILFVNEYGTRTQKARPAIREANEKSAEATTQAAREVYDRWLKSKDL